MMLSFIRKKSNTVVWKLTGIFILFLHLHAQTQITAKESQKLSASLRKKAELFSPGTKDIFFISSNDTDSLKLFLQNKKDIKIVYEYKPANVFTVSTTWEQLQLLLQKREITFADVQRKPKEELALSNLDLSTNKVNILHAGFPVYNGSGTVVSIKENFPDTTDIDFKGRFLSTSLSSSEFSTHASNMATIIAGGGNTYYEGKGVAWGTTISSSSFDILLPEPDEAYRQYNISVQNHSYGTGIENYYGADAAAYDASVMQRPSLLHVFSAGNSGTESDTIGLYKGINGFANITGSFKMAKNIITVGHVDSVYKILLASSRGPAYDGRIKPELVAFAEDGSSGAAALVSGTVLVLQQAYKELKTNLPAASLVKAVLLNSADDIGSKGIDFITGYGNLNAFKAFQTIINNRYFEDKIGSNETKEHEVIIPPGIQQFKATIAWSDLPATPNASKALVNDLDMEIVSEATNQSWLPWVLNNSPHLDSLNQLPVRKKDSMNNAEQVTIDNPLPGLYSIKVKGFSVPGSSLQPYSIAYQFDSLEKFQWYYPLTADNIFGKRVNIIRWNCSFLNNNGTLDYSLDNGISWKNISNDVPLSDGYYKWNAPDTFTTALLRMQVGSANFLSDTFTISKRFDVYVGFNCQDSFLLSWNKIPGVDSFRVFSLGERYMEPMAVVKDSFLIVNKIANTSLYYAVSPLLHNRQGVRSYGFDYTLQGTGCYVQTFLARLSGNSGILNLQLGSLYNIKTLTWQKLNAGNYVDLSTESLTASTAYAFTDNLLTKGVNTYRVKIELSNGQVIYSEPASFFYFDLDKYIAYPNPVKQNEILTILSNETEITTMQVFNVSGAKILEQQLNSQVNNISTGRLSKGIYFIRIMKKGKSQQLFKIFVY